MFSYHYNLEAEHSFSSQWWQWPLIERPVWYYSGETINEERMSIASFGNPAIWWLGLLALFATAWIGLRRRDKRALFLIIGFLSQYLPWVLIPRVTFLYHYFVCVPFLLLMICYVAYYLLCRAHNTDTGANADAANIAVYSVSKKIWIYAGICVVLFALFYPVLSGMPVPDMILKSLKWLPSWTF